eukprot:2153748-Rhodomonas_salina.1
MAMPCLCQQLRGAACQHASQKAAWLRQVASSSLGVPSPIIVLERRCTRICSGRRLPTTASPRASSAGP